MVRHGLMACLCLFGLAALAHAQTTLERKPDSEGRGAQRMSFVELWTPKEESRYYCESAIVIETDWEEGATMYGTVTTFLKWDNEKGYRKFDLATNSHNNGESGGWNSACWWFPMDVDGDTADEPAFLKGTVGAGYRPGEEVWTFEPSKQTTEVFYLDTDGSDEIVRHDVSGERALALLDKMHPEAQPSPTRRQQVQGLWLRLAKAQAHFEAGKRDEAIKGLEELCHTPDFTEIPKELPPFTSTRPENRDDTPPRDEINVYNPLLVYLSAKAMLEHIRGS